MDADGIFMFSDKDLPSSSFSTFEEMKQNEELCDITIKVRNQRFPAHRVILSATIPYFRAMFRSNMKESTKREVSMENADPAALKCLLTFAYTGKLKIPNCGVQSLLETSIYLQLDRVTNACFSFMVKRLSPDNVFTIRALAECENRSDSIEHTDRFIRENFDDVSVTPAFLELPVSGLKGLIRRDDLNVTSEEVVFEAVVKWVKASEVERHNFLTELLQDVRVPFLSPEYLSRVFSSDELIRTLICGNLQDEVKCYLVKSLLNPWSFMVPERYCKEKHHMKCQKVMGCGMYGIVRGTFSSSPCLLDYLLNHGLCYYEFNKEKWTELKDMKEIGNFKYVICLEEKIHLIRAGLVHTFNLKTLESVSLNFKNRIPVGGGIVLHNYKAYIFGCGSDFSRNVCCFDPQLGTCDKVSEMLVCRNHVGIASLGEYIYITGGENSRDKTSLQLVERFNPTTGQSAEISSMLHPRSGHGCAALSGKLYVCGGGSCTAEVYDPVTDQWKFIAPMNRTKSRMSLIPYGGKLYAINVTSHINKSEKDVKIYDPKDDVWKCGKPIPFSHVRVVATNSASPLQF